MSIQAVQKHFSKRNIRGLCRLLSHRDASVRRKAVQALGQLRLPAGVPCLQNALIDPDGIVQQYAISALWSIGTDTAIDALTLALFSPKPKQSTLARNALENIVAPTADAACRAYDILHHSDWPALESMTSVPERHVLSLMLSSEKYALWPSAKRKEILKRMLKLGIRPSQQSQELAQMGLFVGGVHTIFDILRGIYSSKADVRIGAARRLADTDQRWARNILFRRFQREARRENNREVILAFAHALLQLGDTGPISYYYRRLAADRLRAAQDAAQMLAAIGTETAIKALGKFVIEQTDGPGAKNVPMVLELLEKQGPDAIEYLSQAIEHPSRLVKLLLSGVFGRTDHPQAVEYLTRMAQDKDSQIMRNALDGLARQNSEAAADALLALEPTSEKRLVARALASMTTPAAIKHLRTLVPETTTIQGKILGESLEPLIGAYVQVVEKKQEEGRMETIWNGISARCSTDAQGAFRMSVLLNPGNTLDLHLKVTTPKNVVYLGALTLIPGEEHEFRVRLDIFFKQLYVRRLQAET